MSTEAKPPIIEQTGLKDSLPIPPDQQMPVSSPQALKQRLDWGEPGLTILDARDNESFLKEHITGAMLLEFVEDSISSMSRDRDIYVYADGEENAKQAAEKLRNKGFNRVSRIEGGLKKWKSIAGPTEGRAA
ncbi:rhodanese-like domain-containing protein [Crocosphaera chwakensis]|uniref:Rhodanese-like protein n=1 Tax=Crocosphaera chwakensis CCY0110 TaxID=391612 RepID=A3IQF8_9CHRO|nr:rhodanese-like domain-containing protein [Crocosphaera chwakensis]EAZ91233.1 Rhodanese-like protein [Crocosphaera chwakensis CCY0110]